MNVARHDPDLARARRDDAGAIRPDQSAPLSRHLRFHAHHIHHWNAFRDADDQFDARIDRFQNSICRARSRHENHGDVAPGFLARFPDGVEHRHFAVEHLAAFSWRHAGDDVCAVLHALSRMKPAGGAGDSLHNEARVFIYENGHGKNDE